MGLTSDDPYGDFVVRVVNACRIASGQMGSMSNDEYKLVERVRTVMAEHEEIQNITKASIIIRRYA